MTAPQPDQKGRDFDLWLVQHGSPDRTRRSRKDAPPDYAERTRAQGVRARHRLAQDFLRAPRLPWDAVHDVIGHGFLPGQLWSVAASSGHGKTTFVMNLVDGLVADGQTVYMLPLEQPADVVKIHWAALRANVDPVKALTNTATRDEQTRIESELAWQESDAVQQVHFSDDSFVGVNGLIRAAQEAKDFGAGVLIVDYVQRVQADDYQGYRRVVQTLCELAKEHQMPVLGTAQLHRGDGDPVRPFMPPVVDRIEGGKILEQESAVVLGLFRPLVATFSREDALAVRMGQAKIKSFFEPQCMGISVLKSRITGVIGEVVKLEYAHGRIRDPKTDERVRWERDHEPTPPREATTTYEQGDAWEQA